MASHISTQYDLAGRTVRSVNPDPDGSGPEAGGITTSFYDANGNVTQTVDAMGNAGSDAEHHSTVATFDALNRKTDEYLPYTEGEDRPHGVYGYDLSGNMQFRTDAAGNTTTYTIDALGRTTAEQNELTHVRAMQYDSAGNVIQRTDRNGRVTRFEYDELNRKTAERWLGSSGNVIRSFSFTFYADGKMASASDSGGITTLFTYDAMGRVQTLDQTLPADASKHYVLTYGYDQASRLTSLAGTVANLGLIHLTYGYDDAGRLTSIIDTAGDKRVNFTYNSLGQYVTLTRYANAAGTELVAATTYGYDEANRLTSLVHALNDSGETMLAYALQYDVAGRITQLTTPDGASDLTLDNQGQLTGASLTDEDFTYDANGNRTSGGTVTGADNRILEDSTYTYSYDDEGNLLSRTRKDETGSEEFTWDYRNRLTQVICKDGQGAATLTASYAYDAFDRRIRKTVTGSQTLDEQYLYDGTDDGDCVLVLDGSGNVKLRQLRGAGPTDVLAEDRISGGTTTTRWTLADHQGSIRDVASDAAAVVDHIQYDSFGNVIAQTNAAEASRAGYTAAPTDAETGFVYLYHRYFDPRSGRFISQDPIGFGAGDANLYRYVGNDPYGRTDPTGLDGIEPDNRSWFQRAADAVYYHFADAPKGTLTYGATKGLTEAQAFKDDASALIGSACRGFRTPVYEFAPDTRLGQLSEDAHDFMNQEQATGTGDALTALRGASYSFGRSVGYTPALEGGYRVDLPTFTGLSDQEATQRLAEGVTRMTFTGLGLAAGYQPAIPDGPILSAPVGGMFETATGTRGLASGSTSFGTNTQFVTEELNRPYIRQGVRAEVETSAPRTVDGRPIDPNTRLPIDGTPDLGHKTGNEFWRERDAAQAKGLTQKQFNDVMNDPNKYQLEDPSSNRSHKYEQP